MTFDELDRTMRVYETAHDLCVLPELFLVARLDGRGFTRLTKEIHPFEKPFDERVRDMMVETTRHLMECGFRMVYGYTQSDEISLLFHAADDAFGRKLRKLHSVLAGEASAKFSLLLGDLACFDCRISALPTTGRVADYFRWRAEDALRNGLNAHSYWGLRKQGVGAADAARRLKSLSLSDKNELLLSMGIHVNELPAWQRRGVGLHYETCTVDGVDPRTGANVPAVRRRLKVEEELPVRDAYGAFVRELLA